MDTILLWCLTLLNHINSSLHLLSIATEFSCYFVNTYDFHALFALEAKGPQTHISKTKRREFRLERKNESRGSIIFAIEKNGVFLRYKKYSRRLTGAICVFGA